MNGMIYSIKIKEDDLLDKKGVKIILRVVSFGYVVIVYVNGEYVGNKYGSYEMKSFVFKKLVKFKFGDNYIFILGVLIGFFVSIYLQEILFKIEREYICCDIKYGLLKKKKIQDSGLYMEKRFVGLCGVFIIGLKLGECDLIENNYWGYLVCMCMYD